MVDHIDYMQSRTDSVTHQLPHLTPSEFAEAERYLPASVTPYPGPYRFRLNPFMREPIDCFDLRSPVREVNMMKGVQITYSTVAETILGYAAKHVKTSPCQWLANDDGNAKKRLDNNILPMFVQSGWSDVLQATDHLNTRKQAVKVDKMSWLGGGYCIFSGVQTGGKLRQDSIQFQLKDELDAWPELVDKDGCPDEVSDDRCAAFWEVRKIFRGSTPLLAGSSKIYRRFMQGDQRHYYVKCQGCGHPQYLRWKHTNKENGIEGGFHWETGPDGELIVESVHYACVECGHKHYEHDKPRLFDPENGAEWRPTATPKEPGIRSYKLPALYSPLGMQPWYKCVATWLKAWDIENNRPRDVGTLQKFYNNVLAEPFEAVGDRVKMHMVSKHRRRAYNTGEIPNNWAADVAGSHIGLLITTVDVQGDWLAVATWGFGRGNQVFLIESLEIEGDTERIDNPAWVQLQGMIENKQWVADDGKIYRPAATFIDSGYRPDTVYNFCAQYSMGVIPIKGRDMPPKASTFSEFHPFTTKLGTRAFNIVVDIYKDRMSMALKMDWDPNELMQEWLFSAPLDVQDKTLKHLTVEYKRQKMNERTGQPMGWEWYRPQGSRNELWDLLIYAVAGLEIVAWELLINQLEREYVEWGEFWELVISNKLYYTDGQTNSGG